MDGKTYVMSDEGLVVIDETDGGGEARKLGCLPVSEPPSLCASLGDSMPLLSESEAKAILDSKDRQTARERYGSDWILSQNGIGACNYYAMAAALERVMYDRTGVRTPLWAAAAYAREVNGRDRGSSLSASFRDVQEKGCPPMSARGGTKEHVVSRSSVPAAAYTEGERFKGFEAYWVKTEEEAVTALALGFKMVIALTAGGSYGRLDKYGISGGGGGMGNHALCLDDVVYDREMGGFKLDQPNSWGTSWADGGRCFLAWNKHIAGPLRNHGAWALRSALDDPNDPNLLKR